MVTGGLATKTYDLTARLCGIVNQARQLRAQARRGDRRAQAQIEDMADCRPRLMQMRDEISALLDGEPLPSVKWAGPAAAAEGYGAKPLSFARTSPPAFKSWDSDRAATALLSRPLLVDADQLAGVAAHEAGHALVAIEMGGAVDWTSALMRVTYYERWPDSPMARTMIAVAGGKAEHGLKLDRALASGHRTEFLPLLSPSDWKSIGDALDLPNGQLDDRSLELLRKAASIAGAYLASHSRRVEVVTDALLRNVKVTGAEVQALSDYADRPFGAPDFSPRDPLREPPRLLNFASI